MMTDISPAGAITARWVTFADQLFLDYYRPSHRDFCMKLVSYPVTESIQSLTASTNLWTVAKHVRLFRKFDFLHFRAGLDEK